MRLSRVAVVATAAAGVLAVGVPAFAYFALSSNAATATATARTLGSPAVGTPAASLSGVSFTVSAPASGPAPTGYRVDRTAPTAASAVCALPAAGGTCADATAVGGQTNTYAVYALLGTWQSLTPATVSADAPAGSFAVTPATTSPVAGTPFTVTLTAKNGAATDTTYSGSKTLTWDGGKTIGAHSPVYPSPVTFTNGVATVSVTLHKAGPQTLSVADANFAAYAGSAGLTVVAATPALAFSTCPNPAPRNSSFTTTVTRTGTDPYGNPVATPAITVTLAPSTGSAKFTTATTTIANGALASASVTFNTPSGSGATAVLAAGATGYATGTCSITTS